MHTSNAFSAPGDSAPAMPKAAPQPRPERFDAIHNDFIPHPAQFPLRYRRHDLFPWRTKPPVDVAGDVGLSFRSAKYIPAGTRIELEIPLRGVSQRFSATVVMVREDAHGYEIGLWFATDDDATRARIVEKICHTECLLRARQSV